MADIAYAANPQLTGSTQSLTRDRFFLWTAFLMLALILVGFAPTFFLRALFEAPELPLRLHVHGAVFTSWFVLFAVQTSLVARRSIALHRRLGAVGAAIAVAMVVSGLVILYFSALNYSGSDESLFETTLLVCANLALLSLFTAFLGLGLAYRRRRHAHQRLMLLACFSMMSQSLARLGRFPALQLSDSRAINELVYGLGGLVALLIALCLHDLLTGRRLHPVTAFGCPTLLGTILFAALVLPNTSIAQALILWLN